MPQWIHDRAEHLLAKNPSMDKSQAFAIATQQSHRLGKSSKGYGTAAGKKRAKAKFDKPKKEYVKTPNPGKLESPKMASALSSELIEILKVAKDQIPGGKADDKTDADFPKDQVVMGEKVELEHTDKPTLAREIARDHLEEFRDYYTRLKKMEQEAEASKEAKVLTMKGRTRIKEKNFAIPSGKGPGGTGKYPIHDAQHAKSALTFVARHGTPAEKSQVYAAVAKKYPGLAGRSSVSAVREAKKEAAPNAQSVKALRAFDLGKRFATTASSAKAQAEKARRVMQQRKVAEVDSYYFMLDELEKMAVSAPAVKPLNTLDPAKQLRQTQDVGRVGAFEPKDGMKLTEYKPLSLIKKSFQVSEYSGPLSMGSFSYRNPQFQSSLPGAEKLSGPDPEAEEGDREHFPENEKKAALWKAAHFACSAIGSWQEKNRR